MKKIKISHNCSIIINNLNLTYFQERLIRKNLQRINHRVPPDAIINLNLSFHDEYHAQLSITSSEFGCQLEADSSDSKELLKNIFKKCKTEISGWKRSMDRHTYLAPYFGGYPSYYKELRISV